MIRSCSIFDNHHIYWPLTSVLLGIICLNCNSHHYIFSVTLTNFQLCSIGVVYSIFMFCNMYCLFVYKYNELSLEFHLQRTRLMTAPVVAHAHSPLARWLAFLACWLAMLIRWCTNKHPEMFVGALSRLGLWTLLVCGGVWCVVFQKNKFPLATYTQNI